MKTKSVKIADIKVDLRVLTSGDWAAFTDEEIAHTTKQHTIKEVAKARQQFHAPSKKSCVYFVQGESGGLVKIGFAANINSRLQNLQTGSPVILNVIKALFGHTRHDEKVLHAHFADYRKHGEWFDASVLEMELPL